VVVIRHILLVSARTRDAWRPSGLEYIAGALATAGYHVEVLDLALEDDPAGSVSERLSATAYDVIGISIYNTQQDTGRDRVAYYLPDIREMIADLRSLTPAPIILGGYGFSLQPNDILNYVGGDYGVAGCGVPAVFELLKMIDAGVAEPGTVMANQAGPYLPDGFKRDLVDVARYDPDAIVYVSANDGCIEDCYHCPFGRDKVPLRLRPVAAVVEEIRSLAGQGVARVKFASCMINASVDYAEKLCKEMAKLPVTWSANVMPTPRLLPPHLVEAMQRSAMFQVDLGSRIIGSEAMLKVYRQSFGVEDIEYAMKLFRQNGITTSWFTGFGAPGETRQTIDETFDLIDRTGVDKAEIITRARIYRDAELFAIAVDQGIVSPDDKLLEPVYYPFAEELRDYIWAEAEKRDSCTVYY
jgi:radical SAM superfamily enzyme YgiQ (UPF0313 family)